MVLVHNVNVVGVRYQLRGGGVSRNLVLSRGKTLVLVWELSLVKVNNIGVPKDKETYKQNNVLIFSSIDQRLILP